MAGVTLSDIIDVKVFQDIPAVNSPEKSRLVQSGIVMPGFDSKAKGEGKIVEMPFWNDIDGTTEVNYSDDTDNTATPMKVSQGEQIARKAFVNKGFKAADLAREIGMGADAMDHIRARTDNYFMHQWQRRIIASANGILEDNVANYGGDMVVDIATEDGVNATATQMFNADAFIDANFTAGDSADMFGAIGVHSMVYARMLKNDEIDFVKDSTGTLDIPTYKGKTVIVDDTLPVVAGATSGFKYTSVLFGAGAFGYGNGDPTVPVEVERLGSAGNGGGQEILHIRKTWLLHPYGFQQTGTPAAESFSLAELATTAVWDRVVARKNVPLAFLITN